MCVLLNIAYSLTYVADVCQRIYSVIKHRLLLSLYIWFTDIYDLRGVGTIGLRRLHFLQSGDLARHFCISYCVVNIVTDMNSFSDTDTYVNYVV